MPAGPEVVILAGGPGTRLHPFTLERPKTLIPVCNVPLFFRLLGQLTEAGFTKATATLPPMDPSATDAVLRGVPPGFELVIDPGTAPFGGTIAKVAELLSEGTETALVIYGDSLLSADFRRLVAAHEQTLARNGSATILYHSPDDIRRIEQNSRSLYGVMTVENDGHITVFEEKPLVGDIRDEHVANAAVFLCETSLLRAPRFRGARDFSYNLFEPAVGRKLTDADAGESPSPLYGCSIDDGFRMDVGNVPRLVDANLRVLRGELKGALPGVEVEPGIRLEAEADVAGTPRAPVLVGRRAIVAAGARVGPDVVIGNDCFIGPKAVIERAVIMEGCRIEAGAVVRDAILGPFSVVAAGMTLPQNTVLPPHGRA